MISNASIGIEEDSKGGSNSSCWEIATEFGCYYSVISVGFGYSAPNGSVFSVFLQCFCLVNVGDSFA